MTDSLKKKTVSGLIWNAIDKVGFQFVVLLVGVITARLLSPKDFGLIGALALFSVLSGILVESGFSAALIRRKENTDEEYTAVFYFNLILSLFLYTILYFAAPYIAEYFKMPELTTLARFLFLSLILTSCGLVQNIILTKEIAFKPLTIANILSVVLSGLVTVIMVMYGFGYWALAWQLVLQAAFRTILFWIISPWRLKTKTDFRIIKEVFKFSALLLGTSVIVATVRYIYNIIIGRLYAVQSLGYYSQAFKYQQITTTIISTTINGVAFPVLAKLKDNQERQLTYVRKIIRIISFMIFPSMILIFEMSNELITIILTDKWLPSVPYLRILLVAGIVYPLHSFYLSLMVVNGHVKKNFLLEMIRIFLVLGSLFFCMQSVEKMLYGFVIASFTSYLIDLFFVKKIIHYKIWFQIKDVLPYLVISLAMYVVVYFIGKLDLSLYPRTILQLSGGAIFYFLTLYFLGSKVIRDTMDLLKK